MSDAPLETLLRPFDQGLLPLPTATQCVLVLRARRHRLWRHLPAEALTLTQPFKPAADELQADGWQVADEQQALQDGPWDLILLLPPRGREEARALMARAVSALAPQGRLIVSVANNEGAKSVQTDLERLLGSVASDTKNKCRVLWTPPRERLNLDAETAAAWSAQSELRTQTQTGLWTRPGVFSWQHADPASNLLVAHLPTDLRGHAADLGAGTGHLSIELLQANPGIVSLDAYEAQQQALEPLQRNLQPLQRDTHIHWHDVESGLPSRYDVIVMNPPFHAISRDGRTDIGLRFIEVAAGALKPRGRLLMVANRHLPYEESIRRLFPRVAVLAEAQGFKVLHAWRE